MKYLVIGDPVAHSLSPCFQNAGFQAYGWGAPYGMRRVTAAELPEFAAWARRELLGFNITVPHKHAIIPWLDSIAPEARRIGSVNTVTVREGKLHGDSTDGYGLLAALAEAFGFTPRGAKALIVGAGGAAQAAAYALAGAGVGELYIVNRTRERAAALACGVGAAFPEVPVVAVAPEAAYFDGALVIQATSAGLAPEDPVPVAAELLGSCRAFFEMIYAETPLLRQVRQLGVAVADGRGMLLYQGARSFELWTGKPAPLAAMRAALATALKERES